MIGIVGTSQLAPISNFLRYGVCGRVVCSPGVGTPCFCHVKAGTLCDDL